MMRGLFGGSSGMRIHLSSNRTRRGLGGERGVEEEAENEEVDEVEGELKDCRAILCKKDKLAAVDVNGEGE